MAGLLVPLVPAGSKAQHLAIERGDYIGSELVPTDANARPVSAVYTQHSDGSHDTTVYLPTATADADDVEEARDGLV
jgi:hypothetical protein